jgi:hypothetical protein
MEEIHRCLDRCTVVRFDEQLLPSSLLTIISKCSGFALGASNWILSTASKKVSHQNYYDERLYIYSKVAVISTSSTLGNQFSDPMDCTDLDDVDIWICSGYVPGSMSWSRAINALCQETGKVSCNSAILLIFSLLCCFQSFAPIR